MGMTAATKLRALVGLAESVTAIELIVGAEALEHRRPLSPGRGVKAAYDIVRSQVAPLLADRSMSAEIEAVAAAIRAGEFDEF
jgi:histidine ammonia-lyase